MKKIQSVTVLFEKYPQLGKLVRNPLLVNDSAFSSSLISNMMRKLGSVNDGDFYKLVFKKDSSRDLMTIGTGELAGLKSSIVVEKGNIVGHAGLQKIDGFNAVNVLPIILNLGFYGALRSQINHLSNIVIDVRNQQLMEEQAKFERVSETIVECAESLPNIFADLSLRPVYLSRILSTYDDCLELFYVQREKFRLLEDSQIRCGPFCAGWTYNNQNPSEFFERKLLNHPIFSVFERLVGCRLSEVLISGNFSDENIAKNVRSLRRVIDDIKGQLSLRLSDFREFTRRAELQLSQGYFYFEESNESLQRQLNFHREYVRRIEGKIHSSLDGKLDSFQIIKHLAEREEIELIFLDGVLILNDGLLSMPPEIDGARPVDNG